MSFSAGLLLLLLQGAAAEPEPLSPPMEGNCQLPRWSATGAHLSYEVNYHDRKVIEQYLMESGGPPVLVQPGARGSSNIASGFRQAGSDMVVHELSFSPDSIGSYIYSASGLDRDYDLYLKGGSRIASHEGTDGSPVWSPDGQYIVFSSSRTGEGDLYLLETAHLEAAPRQLTADATASELYPAWSPDSQKLVFVGHTRTGDSLYLIDDLAYPAPRPITSWGHTQTRPTFSPDGTQIAFYSNHQDTERFDLYVMPVGGQPRLLAESVLMNGDGPAWMPDSQAIVTVLDDGDRFDPVSLIPIRNPRSARILNTGTVGNADHALVRQPDGVVYMALAARGTEEGRVRDYRRIFIVAIPYPS